MYVEHTYKVETVVDIFSKVSGLFYTVSKIQLFLLSSFLTYYATKYIMEDIFSGSAFTPRPSHTKWQESVLESQEDWKA